VEISIFLVGKPAGEFLKNKNRLFISIRLNRPKYAALTKNTKVFRYYCFG